MLPEEKLNKINATLEYLGNPLPTLHKLHKLPQATTN
jgi:hypothetical protein